MRKVGVPEGFLNKVGVPEIVCSAAKAPSTVARSRVVRISMRTFMDKAAENSVTTQSLMHSESARCEPSQSCISLVRGSRVSAATRMLVSR